MALSSHRNEPHWDINYESLIAYRNSSPVPEYVSGKSQEAESVGGQLYVKCIKTDSSAIVEPYLHTYTAVCLQKTTALSISGSKLERLLQDNQKIGHEVLKGLIKMVASSLDDTRHVLVSERLLARLK